MSIFIDTYGTGVVTNQRLVELVREHFDLTPRGIIEELKLLSPIYRKTAAYGHFGRSEFEWEKTTKAKILKKEADAQAVASVR